jgi:hypothetical protein
MEKILSNENSSLTQWFDPEPTFKGLAFARSYNDKVIKYKF